MNQRATKKRLTLLSFVVVGFALLIGMLFLDQNVPRFHNAVTPTELLQTCWQGNQATYSRCSASHSIMWDRKEFPLSVSIVMAETTPFNLGEAEIYTAYAVEQFNEQLNFEAFRYEEFQMEAADIVVIWNVHIKQITWLGSTRHNRRLRGPTSMNAMIHIGDRTDNNTVYNTVFHELGHAIGLNHDAKISSPMYPTVDYVSALLEQDDVDILRQLYAPR
jgi:hypothetical protein